MARAALHNGALLGWEPGLGKTMPAYSMPFIWRARRCLTVVQADLHEQLIEEGRNKFGVEVRVIDSQETALRYMLEGLLPFPGSEDRSPLPDGEMPSYFITAYNWLGYNGADEWKQEEPNELTRLRRVQILRRLFGLEQDPIALKVTSPGWRPRASSSAWEILGIKESATGVEIKQAFRTAAKLWHPDLHPGDASATSRFQLINAAYEKLTGKDVRNFQDRLAEFTEENGGVSRMKIDLDAIETGIGEERDGIRCVFAPSLASIVSSTFDCVVCDEAVAIKSGVAYQAQGVLRMKSKYRLALTGTPIKNNLPDIFFLCSWVTGYHEKPTARFPYGNDTEARAQFASDFGVIEENLTKAQKAAAKGESNRRFVKTDPTQICNIHRLWRLLGPVLIRRRKDDVPGCDIVSKTVIPVHVMPGTEQKRVYAYHVNNPPAHESLLASLGAQLQCLRQASLHPSSASLRRVGIKESAALSPLNPKTAAIFQLAQDLMNEGEQVVIFSPFQEFSAELSARFSAASVPNLLLDGNMAPQKRGKLIKDFKSGEYPVLIAGIKGMASGHNLDCCANLILPGLEWALDLNRQAVDRIHRLTSKKGIRIFVMITKGTIDERLAAVWQEKGDSSDLALDGRLVEETRAKLDLSTFLQQAVDDFDPDAETLDEREILTRWNLATVNSLRESYSEYRRLRPVKTLYAARTNIPQSRKIRPSSRPKTTASQSPPLQTIPPRPRSLFEIMKLKRQGIATALPAVVPSAPPPRPLPMFKPRTTPPRNPEPRAPLRL